ncbi:MAG: phosphatidylinositol-specific phospholipase C/glycerophosphodiester phosphodiesterase family protein [Sedimentisphaerales bacterium]|nr:phosphatidylinositol-specific phospholipase C/glycerophosphodiester phosphodiesterase family protein [Sedimentisphaerales bacterium]
MFRFVSWSLVALLAVVLIGCEGPGPIILTKAHAHNDYQHARPLFDALENGFCSVEADIHLVNGELLVAHDAEDVQVERTLQKLYLDPLHERVKKNGGHVFRGGPEFILWIDIKTDAVETYLALHEVLSQYANMLTVVSDNQVRPGPIQVVISGNRAPGLMKEQKIRYSGMDGRLSDINSDEPVHFMPWISDSASKLSNWDGNGSMPEADRQKLYETVREVHSKGRKFRLWGTPDQPVIWKELQVAGVDILNADNLPALRDFLLAQSGH